MTFGPTAGGAAAPIVGQQYCLPQEQVFFLTEKLMSVSGDDFEVVDALNPSHRYQLKSSSMSMSGSRQLKDSAGKTILNMKHKVGTPAFFYLFMISKRASAQVNPCCIALLLQVCTLPNARPSRLCI